MAWRIEQAKTDRSTCRQCNRPIGKGEYRFGNDDLNAFWYHLRCASEGKPRAFKPFAAKAAKLIASAPKPAAKTTKPAATAKRNPELEAKLAANRDDAELRGVFADWLQSQGDPWGELIALTSAGKASAAKRVLKEHAESLSGGFGPRTFDWDEGFIERVTVKGASARKDLAAMLQLRTARFARALYLPMKIDDTIVVTIAKHAPPTLRALFTWIANPVGKLACSTIERLTLYLDDEPLDLAAFAPLFAATSVPALRQLEMYNSPLSVEVVTALLDSKLMKQLDGLELHQGAIGPDSEAYLIANKAKLAHLTYMDFGHDATPALETTFGKQLAKRNSVARYGE